MKISRYDSVLRRESRIFVEPFSTNNLVNLSYIKRTSSVRRNTCLVNISKVVLIFLMFY